MKPDSWLTAEVAKERLVSAGYHVDIRDGIVAYRRAGVSGKLNIHAQGVDEWAVLRIEDRGP